MFPLSAIAKSRRLGGGNHGRSTLDAFLNSHVFSGDRRAAVVGRAGMARAAIKIRTR